jgi:hypothetical protein
MIFSAIDKNGQVHVYWLELSKCLDKFFYSEFLLHERKYLRVARF